MGKTSKLAKAMKESFGTPTTIERVKSSNDIPDYDTLNVQGHPAYSIDDVHKLVGMLNTLKVEPQYYRKAGKTIQEIRDAVEKVALSDPYFVAQAIAWSRCRGEKMRTVNHIAAAFLSPFITGKDFAKRFYGPYDRKKKQGGCIYRTDDMTAIKDVYSSIYESPLSSAMKKGFAAAIESMDEYQLAKYKKDVINIGNIVHPNSSKSSAVSKVVVDGVEKEVKTIDAIFKGLGVKADTWETANSEAGEIVADAVKSGKISEEEAKKVLAKAKNENWGLLLSEGKLGVIAAIKNIRNIVSTPDPHVVDMLCDLLSDGKKIRESGILPYQIDIAYDVAVRCNHGNMYASAVGAALAKGYMASIPNLADALPGKTLVVIDCSGSMTWNAMVGNRNISSTCLDKASIIAATVKWAKRNDCDVIRFGSFAEYMDCDFMDRIYDNPENVFNASKFFGSKMMGNTNLASVFRLITKNKKVYDRIIVLSDNECNTGLACREYRQYVRDVCDPYVYGVDLAVYGTTALKGPKVGYYFGYGYSLFEDFSSREFNPEMHIEEIKRYVI